MSSATKPNFQFHLILIDLNQNLKSHTWLVAKKVDSKDLQIPPNIGNHTG